MEENKENQAKEILKEDEDLVVGVDEIQRIVMLYLGRESTPEEIQRFEGIHESEIKIMTDYLSEEKTKVSDETKNLGDANKIQGDLANKEMKIQGDNALQQMKQLGAVPPMPMAGGMPPEGAMPVPGQPPMQGEGLAPKKKWAQDGRFFPVKFSG